VTASFSAVLIKKDFDALVKKLPKGSVTTSYPYLFMLVSIVTAVGASLRKLNMQGPVKYIFDRQLMQEKKVLGLWDIAMQDMWPENRAMVAGPPVFEDDKEFEALQAADLEAWWTRRRAYEIISKAPRLEYFWQPSRSDLTDIVGWWDKEALRKHFKHRARVLGYGEIDI
jgi:hypothetical protein